jgi:hypothetical protein
MILLVGAPESRRAVAAKVGGRRRALGEPRVRTHVSENVPPNIRDGMKTVRELRSRPALASSAGNRTSLRGSGGEPGSPFFFGDFLLGRARRKSPAPGPPPRDAQRS